MGKKFKNKDLAARLGLSGTLVSLVLNNKADQQGIRKDTQEKVLALARQMGFFDTGDELTAPLPVEEKPGILGMVVPSMNDPFIMQISPYLQKAFSSIGVGFSVITKDPDDQRYDRMIGAFRKFFSGLILVGEAADDNTIRALRNADYPFILLEKNVKSLHVNSVSSDFSNGASLVSDHISKLGYRNVLIVPNPKVSREENSNVTVLTEALNKREGLNKPVVLNLEKPISGDESDYMQFERYLRPPYRADIMIVMNAGLVYPIMAMLKARKLRIPQDIAIISMEEAIGFDILHSPVTCLRKPFSGMSIKVANMIWSEIKNSGKSKFKRQVIVPPELIIRNSCGTI